ncbi:TIR domain-containing protein [Actinoplanes sp. NPDC049599]|uniref:TIR domain-containing protein n=1 Tax=Actinoplanes sp. NPDC049599 TaxID=3363903 RepID=UPI0037AF3799
MSTATRSGGAQAEPGPRAAPVDDVPPTTLKRYDAFISYSHAQSRAVAVALQRELERFAKPWYRSRRLRIFRDETDLAASPHLWSVIEQALAASQWLILMASSDAARSPWVRREVAWWLANRSVERILIAVTGGEVAWADDDVDWDRTDALPQELAGSFADEPLWVDLRRLVPSPSANTDLGTAGGRPVHLGDLVAEFAAPIHGRDKDSLVGEHVRQLRRTRRTVQSAVAALTVLLTVAVTAGIVAVGQRNDAVRQRDLANARRVAAQADALRERRPDLSLLLAVEALKIAPVAEAQASIAATLGRSHFAGSLPGSQDQINDVDAHPAGRTVATASSDGAVVLWDISDRLRRTRLSTLTGSAGPVEAIDFDRGGHLLAAAGPMATVLWDVTDQARPRRLAQLAGSAAVRFSPTVDVLFAAGALWDVSDRSRPVRLASVPAGAAVRDADISDDGRTLAVAARPNPTTLWDVTNPRRPSRLAEIGEPGDAVAVNADGRFLALAPRDGPAQVWRISNRARPVAAGSLAGATGTTVFDIAFSPDASTVATAEGDGTGVWSFKDPEHPVQSFRLHGHAHEVYAVTYAMGGQRLVTGGPDGVALVWSTVDQENAIQLARLGWYDAEPDILRFSRDDQTLVTAGDDDVTDIWEISDRADPVHLAAIGSAGDFTFQVDLSPDGTTMVRGVADQAPTLWDITNPSHPTRLADVGTVPGRADFAPDGRTLVRHSALSGADLWDVSRRDRPVRIGAVGPIADTVGNWAAFSPDGRTLAITGPADTELWRTADPYRPVRLSTIHGVGRGVAFRPDGRILAGVDAGSVLSLWDVTRADRPVRVGSVPGTNGGYNVVFVPDGRTVVTGSSDAVAVVWDVTNPAAPIRAGQANGHSGSVYNVAMSHDGRTLATGSSDRTVALWDMPAQVADLRSPVAVACALAGPSISRGDWEQYLPDLRRRDVC